MKGEGKSNDIFALVNEDNLPKTPRRQRNHKSDQSRQRSGTEPAPLRSAFKLTPSYHPPRALKRPFFPYQISHTRRAGTDELSPSTALSGQSRSHESIMRDEGTPSRPLFILANAASDVVARNREHGEGVWPQSRTLTDIGGEDYRASISSAIRPDTMTSTRSVPLPVYLSVLADC